MSYKRLFFILFWIALFTDCYFIIDDLQEYRLYSKSLLVPILLFAIFFGSKHSKHQKSKVLINMGLLFCFFGDILLLQHTGISNFVLGLFSFLIALVLFNIFFLRQTGFRFTRNTNLATVVVLVLLYLGALFWILYPKLQPERLEIPVAAYSLVMAALVVTAFNTQNTRRIKRLALHYYIPGSIFFMLSDSLLALDRFYSEFRFAGVAVMLTYGIALYLLSVGFVRFLGNGSS